MSRHRLIRMLEALDSSGILVMIEAAKMTSAFTNWEYLEKSELLSFVERLPDVFAEMRYAIDQYEQDLAAFQKAEMTGEDLWTVLIEEDVQ